MKEIESIADILISDKPVVVDFWAPWCGPCKMVSPVLDSIAEERTDINFIKVNADENPDIVKIYDVISIPTLLIVTEGSIISSIVGAKPKAAIIKWLDENI